MKKLQAAMKDASARKIPESNLYYRVGSYFKGCHHCGEYEVDISDSGRERKRYTSGFQVFRSYYPNRTKWTYWCYECGSKDAACWENAELGGDAVRGSKNEYKCQWKLAPGEEPQKSLAVLKRLRKQPEVKPPDRAAELAQLEDDIKRLEQMLLRRNQ